MSDSWQDWLSRWTAAGLIDEAAAERIRSYERTHPHVERLSWPVRLSLGFGAIAVGAGILLFVSAHWDALSPAARFSLVLLLTAVFHVGAACVTLRLPSLATTLHALGTLALGASVFLTGQIFNLREHWPGGLMLWTLGAAVGWLLLRDRPQLALVATLAPLWLAAEWIDATDQFDSVRRSAVMVLAVGLFLLTVSYFTACLDRSHPAEGDRYRRLLSRLGTAAFLPAACFMGIMAHETGMDSADGVPIPAAMLVIGWMVAIGVPAAVAWLTRGSRAWPFALVAAWALLLWPLRDIGAVLPFAWWALGSVGLVAWGIKEAYVERINWGTAVFGATVLAFYFSQVMDKLDRSASLLLVGILFLAGGAILERVRRRLVLQALLEAP